MVQPKNTSSKVDILDIELQEVTKQMSQNISQTLENIELTYDLESGTEELREQSKQFKKQSTIQHVLRYYGIGEMLGKQNL